MQSGAYPLTSVLPIVKVLLEGRLKREGGVIVDASSSVTLIESFEKRILVDTGSPEERSQLLESLRSVSLTPEDIDIVVNTHLHIDHCGCNDLFDNAKMIAHESEAPPVGFTRVSGGMTLDENVEIVPTPGHTPGCISVFVRSDKRIAICGDAVPTRSNYDSNVPPFISFDKKLAVKSMEAIIGWAEVIVPGHDKSFEVRRKK